jgi:hypothetical protein
MHPDRTVIALVAVASLAAGCFEFAPDDGVYSCGPVAPCPTGYACTADNHCRRSTPGDDGGGSTPDGGDSGDDVCDAIYVSAAHGSSDGDGCRNHPLADIGSAITRQIASTREIHVCKGRYQEDTLGAKGIIRGGYDCESWQRTATYGHPTFDRVNETVVINQQRTPVVWLGGGVVILDGLTITAQPMLGEQQLSSTVDLSHGQTVIDDCIIEGMSASTTFRSRSVAVFIHDDADVELTHDRIAGGGGQPSTGVLVDGTSVGRVHIHDNVIDGGTGVDESWVGAMGVEVDGNDLTLDSGTALEHNYIYGGHGNQNISHGAVAGLGILVYSGGHTDVVGNVIDGGHGEAQNGTLGILRVGGASGTLRVRANRVSGGHMDHASVPVFGMRLYGVGPLEVDDNMILADGGDSSAGARGISLAETAASVAIRHNTIFVTGAANNAAVWLEFNARRVSLDNNILAGTASSGSAALVADDCPDVGALQAMRNNLNAGMPLLRYGQTTGDCVAGDSFVRDDWAETELESRCPPTGGSDSCTRMGGTRVSQNVTVAPLCGQDQGCIVRRGCQDPADCGRALFVDGKLGDEALLLADGWRLTTGIPCAVAESSLDLRADVKYDLYGTQRPDKPSMGAFQVDDATVACIP